jgi:hypothetical protein
MGGPGCHAAGTDQSIDEIAGTKEKCVKRILNNTKLKAKNIFYFLKKFITQYSSVTQQPLPWQILRSM